MSFEADEIKASADIVGEHHQTVDGMVLDGDRLFLFDSSRLEDKTSIESDLYVDLEEVR